MPGYIAQRLGAFFYDTFLIVSIWILGTGLAMCFTQGQAIAADNMWYKLYLILLYAGFWIGFWLRGGQTTGMVAWRIRVVDRTCRPITWQQACLRFLYAIPSTLCFGLGWLWAWFDKNAQPLHDKLSGTQVVYVPKARHD